jgi:hypothetical protein
LAGHLAATVYKISGPEGGNYRYWLGKNKVSVLLQSSSGILLFVFQRYNEKVMLNRIFKAYVEMGEMMKYG